MNSAEIPLPHSRSVERVAHPCEFIQRDGFAANEALRLHRIRATQSIGAAVNVALTDATLLSGRRLGGMPCSNALYHHNRGDFMDINPEDVYGQPQFEARAQPAPRALAEREIFGYELTMKNLNMM